MADPPPFHPTSFFVAVLTDAAGQQSMRLLRGDQIKAICALAGVDRHGHAEPTIRKVEVHAINLTTVVARSELVAVTEGAVVDLDPRRTP